MVLLVLGPMPMIIRAHYSYVREIFLKRLVVYFCVAIVPDSTSLPQPCPETPQVALARLIVINQVKNPATRGAT